MCFALATGTFPLRPKNSLAEYKKALVNLWCVQRFEWSIFAQLYNLKDEIVDFLSTVLDPRVDDRPICFRMHAIAFAQEL